MQTWVYHDQGVLSRINSISHEKIAEKLADDFPDREIYFQADLTTEEQ